MPSIEHEQIVAMMAGGLGLEGLSVDEQRAVMEASAEMFPVASDVQTVEVEAGGVPADWVSIADQETDRVVLYFHGGAYVMGSRTTHRALAGRIARASQARVLLPDYRLAPENPFPAAVDDPMLTLEGLRSSGRDYAAGDLKNPLAAPLLGDLGGLPPLLLQVGSREILLSDSTRFADKARAAGVEVTLEVEEGLIHVWQMLPGVPEAERAVDRIGAFVKSKC